MSGSYICPGKYLLKPWGLLYVSENTNVKAGKYDMFTVTKVKLMMRKNKVAEEVLILLYVH